MAAGLIIPGVVALLGGMASGKAEQDRKTKEAEKEIARKRFLGTFQAGIEGRLGPNVSADEASAIVSMAAKELGIKDHEQMGKFAFGAAQAEKQAGFLQELREDPTGRQLLKRFGLSVPSTVQPTEGPRAFSEMFEEPGDVPLQEEPSAPTLRSAAPRRIAPVPVAEEVAQEQVTTQPVAEAEPQQRVGNKRLRPGQSISINKNGITFSERGVSSTVSFQRIKSADGRGEQVVKIVTDAEGNTVSTTPIGPAASPERIQTAERIVEDSFRVPRSSPFFNGFVSEVLKVQIGPERRRDFALEELRKDAATLEQQGLARAPTVISDQPSQPVAPPTTPVAPITPEVAQAPTPAPSQPRGSLAERSQQAEIKFEAERQATIERAKVGERPVEAGQRERVSKLNSALRQTGVVEANFNSSFVGKFPQTGFGGLLSRGREFLGTISDEQIDFNNALEDLADLLLRARSGAQINESEYLRLRKLLPTRFNEPNVFKRKMRRFRQEATAQRNETLGASFKARKNIKPIDPSIVPIAGQMISTFTSRKAALRDLKSADISTEDRARMKEAIDFAFPAGL